MLRSDAAESGKVTPPRYTTPAELDEESGSAFVAREGTGDPVLFVHGSIMGAATWAGQRLLAERWTTLILERRGFGRSPPTDGEDFETDARDIAEALGDGAHLVAHSYGGLGALLAAAARPEAVHSLTLVEPVAYSAALDHPAVQSSVIELIDYYTSGPQQPRPFLEGFLPFVGISAKLPDPLLPTMEDATRLLMNARPPFVARLALDDLARAGLRTLVISGAHLDVFEAICDRLAQRLGGERAVIRGAQHAVPGMANAFNERLERFLSAGGR
jgi:pimeloyl-ACP methyl ester carboxylesterase